MLALLFPGQGTQHPDMLPWLDAEPAAAPALAQLAQRLGPDWRRRLADREWATRNAIAQPLLTGVALAAWACLADRLPAPAAVAGYSVGELAACAAAGALLPATAIALATQRAECMDAAAAGHATGLLAVQGAPAALLADVQQRHALALAIDAQPANVVLGGLAAGLDAAAAELAAAGSRCTRLAVALASHTGWMAPAATEFDSLLAAVPLQHPRAPIACNATGATERDPARLRTALVRQLATTVRWSQCMDALAERGVRCALEVGPGTSLSAMWRAAHPQIPVRSVDEFRSAAAVTDWVARALNPA